MVTPVGAAYPIQDTFPSTVFLRQKFGPSWTCDSGIPNVTPFVKASLLKFCFVHDITFRLMLSPWHPVCGWSCGLQHEVEAATSGDVARQQ
jgi:hypothetical protein